MEAAGPGHAVRDESGWADSGDWFLSWGTSAGVQNRSAAVLVRT